MMAMGGLAAGCQNDHADASDGGSGSSGESADDADPSGPVDSSGDETGAGGTVELSGSVQKGPFVLGSSVQVTPIDAAGEPLGDVYPTATNNDLGEFSIELPMPGPVSIESSGFYYNEVSGELSGAELTLRAIYVSSGPGPQEAYVNLITHLTEGRVRTLLGQGQEYGEAITQAEAELRVALGVGLPDFDPAAVGTDMNLLGGNAPANQYLLAVSSVLAQVGVIRAGGVDGPIDANLQAAVNEISSDLADDGSIGPALRAEVDAGDLALDSAAVMAAFAARLAEIGSNADVPNIDEVLDQDDDLVLNIDDNCKQVSNAAQFNTDADAFGDACDNCEAVANDDQIDLDVDEVGDACDSECGDAVVGPMEECDDSVNGNNTDDCTDLCTTPVCGDAIVWSGEDCDDGNPVDGDGCNTGCVASGQVVWELVESNAGEDTAYALDVDSTGATIFIGRSGSGFLRKVTPDGMEDWTTPLAGGINFIYFAITATPNDDVVIAGVELGTSTVARYSEMGDEIDSAVGTGSPMALAGKHPNGIAFAGRETPDAWVGLLDDNLDVVWQQYIPPVSGNSTARSVAYRPDGSLAFGLQLSAGGGSYPNVVSVRDLTGAEIWAVEAFNTNSIEPQVAAGPAGEVVAASHEYVPPALTTSVAAFDADGVPTWDYTHDIGMECFLGGLQMDGQGRTVVGLRVVEDGDATPQVIKLDTDGTLLWTWEYPSMAGENHEIVDIAIDPTNDEILVLVRHNAGQFGDEIWLGRLTQ